MESQELTTITEQPKTQVLAPMTPDDAKAMMLMYQAYQEALLNESDYQDIQGKKFKKKSAWRKFAMANNLSVRIVDERREELPNGDYAYHFVAEATHPNGRVTSGSGSCTAYEKVTWREGKWMKEEKEWNGKYMKPTGRWIIAEPNSLHNVRSTAETRAWNRAVSNMIAAGEVSAEEVDQGQNHYTTAPTQPAVQAAVATTQPAQTNNEDPRCPKCSGAMWDFRMVADGGKGQYPKTNPKAPDWKCKNKECGGVIWPPKKEAAATPPDQPESDEVNIEDIPF